MIRIDFTEEAIEKLRYERFHHPHPSSKSFQSREMLPINVLPPEPAAAIIPTPRAFRAGFSEYRVPQSPHPFHLPSAVACPLTLQVDR